jgi:hypothetical protein
MIKILLSDDNTKLFEDCKDLAYKLKIDLHCVTNWEDAKIELEENFDKYSAIILDGKGLLNPDSSLEDERHVLAATNWLTTQKALGKIMPAYVYTAYINPISMVGDSSEGVIIETIDKNVAFEQVLNKIITYLDATPEVKIRRMFPNPLRVLDTCLLTADDKKNVNDVVISFISNNFKRQDFNIVRNIIEGVFVSANEIDNVNFLKNECFKDARGVNLEWCCRYFAGLEIRDANRNVLSPRADNPLVPKHVAAEFDYLKNITSILSHRNASSPSLNTVNSTVYALLDILSWFYDTVELNYNYIL